MSDPASQAAETLRAKQKPLKDKYRSDPGAALVTLSSSGDLDPSSSSLTCSLGGSAASAAKRVAGLHAAAGGEGFDVSGELCSGDMLLESLVACYGVTVRAVATAMGIEVLGGRVAVDGDLDFRGTMGVKDENGQAVEVGFKRIALKVRVDVNEGEQEKVGKLVELSQRYCVVLQTLMKGVQVDVKVEESQAGGQGKNENSAVRSGAPPVSANVDGQGRERRVSNDEVLELQ